MEKSEKGSLANSHAKVILESVADGVFTVNENMVITYFNKAAERISGMCRSKAIGKYCFDVLKSNICESDCPLRFSIKTGEDIIDNYKNILRPDGKIIPITISASILRDSDGKMIGGVETFRDLSKIEELEKEISKKYTFQDIISKNNKIHDIFSILPNISESESTVLITGQSGTGKELFARAIHNLSRRKDGPFIAINCGALPDTLLESELFGYVKGAFTDAIKDKPGRFELAKGGTIFFDEIDSLPLSTQVKLLRVIQEKEYEPLGSTLTVKTDVRIISASKNELYNLVSEKKFRDDLFYRLNVIKIELPPLAKRQDDIPLLINHFIEKFNLRMHKSIKRASHEVINLLVNYSYEGNIRQLENIMEHSFVMCNIEEIKIEHLPPEIKLLNSESDKSNLNEIPLNKSERITILNILEKNNWNKSLCADELKIHPTTLWRKMNKYKIVSPIA